MAQAEDAVAPRERPVAPHLQVWRWHITMLASILHRATGAALYLGTLGLVVWLSALAAGPQAFETADTILRGPLGQMALYGFTAALGYHLANGVRHLFFDAGRGFRLPAANASAWIALLGLVVAPAGLWALMNYGG